MWLVCLVGHYNAILSSWSWNSEFQSCLRIFISECFAPSPHNSCRCRRATAPTSLPTVFPLQPTNDSITRISCSNRSCTCHFAKVLFRPYSESCAKAKKRSLPPPHFESHLNFTDKMSKPAGSTAGFKVPNSGLANDRPVDLERNMFEYSRSLPVHRYSSLFMWFRPS
jgi:hypothetical protein